MLKVLRTGSRRDTRTVEVAVHHDRSHGWSPLSVRSACRVVEIRPEGRFLTYGLGVPLMRMRDPAVAQGT